MIPVIKWTLRQRRWSIIWWCLGVFGLIFINMIFYPSFKDSAAEFQKSLQNLPDTAVQLFGGSTDLFSPVGFLNSQVFFLMLPMLLAILAIGLGSSLIAREENDLTIELLLARPLSRSRLLAAKAVAGVIILAIVSFAGFLTTLLLGWGVHIGVPSQAIVEASWACFLLSLVCGAIAFLLSAVGRARSASIGVGALVALGGYLVVSLSNTVDWLKGPAKVFPFNYYHSESLLRGSHHWDSSLLYLVIVVVCGSLAWLSFRRRDIG